MRKNINLIKYGWFFIFLIIMIVPSLGKERLRMKSFYPMNDSDYYFRAIIDLEIVKDNLYAVENFGHIVLSFSVNKGMRLVEKIGRQGQGPGDFNLPTLLSIGSGVLVVKDSIGFSFFTPKGQFLRKFRAYSSTRGFIYFNHKIFWISPNPEEEYLIEIYSQEGQKLGHFGQKFFTLDFSAFKGMGPHMVEKFVYDGNLLTDGKFIYYLSPTFGILKKYNLEGKECGEADLVVFFGERGKEVFKNNHSLWIENGIDLKATNYQVPTFGIFDDVYLAGTKIYLIEGNRALEKSPKEHNNCIKEIDINSLELTNEYSFKREEGDKMLSLAVLDSPEGLKFYISMRTSDDYLIREYVREK